MILIDVTLNAQEGKEIEFKSLLQETMAASQSENGCLQYRFSMDINSSNTFYLAETWCDEAALAAHYKSSNFTAFITKLPNLGSVVSSTKLIGELKPYIS